MKTGLLVGVACAALTVSAAKADSDACALLTPAEVSAAAAFTVQAGTHVTPTFLKTCTWTGSNSSGVQFVTLNLQTTAFFDGAKRQAGLVSAAGGSVKSAGVGDDSFYLVQGTQAMLWVKKGSGAFKVAVYKQIPADQKEKIELALARQVVRKL